MSSVVMDDRVRRWQLGQSCWWWMWESVMRLVRVVSDGMMEVVGVGMSMGTPERELEEAVMVKGG